jgi:hypothetical protein
MEQGVAPSGQYLPLGIMPENLKALLYVYSAMVEERNNMSYQVFQSATGKSQKEIEAEMFEVSIADKNINLISSLFFTALEYEYSGDGPVGQIGFFGPNFEVYVLL